MIFDDISLGMNEGSLCSYDSVNYKELTDGKRMKFMFAWFYHYVWCGAGVREVPV